MLRRVVLTAAAVAVGAAGCSRGSGADVAEIDRHETVPVHLTIALKGDITATVDQTVPSRFIVRRVKAKEERTEGAQVVGVEPLDPIKVGGGAFLAGVGVTPFNGDGTYTIPPGSPFDLANDPEAASKPRAVSSIKVDWWANGDPSGDPETYMRRVKPCTVVVNENGAKGELNCPEVTDEARGKHFSLSLRWSAPTTPAPTTTTPAPSDTQP